MKNILVVNGYGNIIDRSHLCNGNITFSNSIGGTFTYNTGLAGNVLVWSGYTWQYNQTATAVASNPVKPKYISAVGGVFFKDQKDESVKYQNVIFGSFTNEIIRE